jgi:tungstate transport system ATP-binding protein
MELSPPLLRAEALVRRYGGRAVVDGASLEVRAGEVLAILGPNGAGKSTLFRMLLLLERPDAGAVLLHGRRVSPFDADARRRIAGVFQRPHLFEGTVEHNIAYGLRARNVGSAERAARVRDALSWVNLSSLRDAPVRDLSGGEAQRVALARALVLEPELLILDEPTANLDVTVRRRFREDLERLARSRARAVILITHDPGDAFALADTVAVMQEGRIVQAGPPSRLVLEPATPFIAAFTGAELLLDGVMVSVEQDLALVEVGGTRVLAAVHPDGAPMAGGARVHIAYRPEDVVIARPEDAGPTSAVNRFDAVIDALVPAGGLVRVRLAGAVPLTALVTRRSTEALRLERGVAIVAQLKATALHAFPAA